MPPRTAEGQALKEQAEAVRDRTVQATKRKERLIGINGKLKVILKPSIEARDAYGKPYITERPVVLNFDGYVCTQTSDGRKLSDPEVIELIERSPAFRGSPNQPKVMAWEGDPLVPWNRQMPVRTLQGPIGVGPRPLSPPYPDWNSLEPDAIRGLINEGKVDPAKALSWEAQNRRRPAVLMDLAEATGRGQAGPDEGLDDQVYAAAATPETFGPPPMGG